MSETDISVGDFVVMRPYREGPFSVGIVVNAYDMPYGRVYVVNRTTRDGHVLPVHLEECEVEKFIPLPDEPEEGVNFPP